MTVASPVVRRPRVFVTVGMGRWPFHRLLDAVASLCDDHDVFAQVGPATRRLACPAVDFLAIEAFSRRLDWADVVVTHAGNTVRLVQRRGLVPLVMARRKDLGEMANDHQVAFLAGEVRAGTAVEITADCLVAQVAAHTLAAGVCPPIAGPTLAPVVADRIARSVLAGDAGRLDGWLSTILAGLPGPHLVLGRDPWDAVPARSTPMGHFGSATVATHSAVPDPGLLGALHRAIRPGGMLALAVPRRAPSNWLDAALGAGFVGAHVGRVGMLGRTAVLAAARP